MRDATEIGYERRLETATFMTSAQQLYRSVGFVDTAAFDGHETAMTPGLDALVIFMEASIGSGSRAPR